MPRKKTFSCGPTSVVDTARSGPVPIPFQWGRGSPDLKAMVKLGDVWWNLFVAIHECWNQSAMIGRSVQALYWLRIMWHLWSDRHADAEHFSSFLSITFAGVECLHDLPDVLVISDDATLWWTIHWRCSTLFNFQCISFVGRSLEPRLGHLWGVASSSIYAGIAQDGSTSRELSGCPNGNGHPEHRPRFPALPENQKTKNKENILNSCQTILAWFEFTMPGSNICK